jgi:hypothetical protein
MKNLLRATVLAGALLSGGAAAHAQVSVGISIGAPPPPRVLRVRPVAPGPEYFWVDGYWYPAGGRYIWHQGYWTRPPYGGAHWVGPRWEGGHYYVGYWDGPRGRFEHDHRWDHDRYRDYRDHH